MATPDFRAQSRAVRIEARAKLRELRAARLRPMVGATDPIKASSDPAPFPPAEPFPDLQVSTTVRDMIAGVPGETPPDGVTASGDDPTELVDTSGEIAVPDPVDMADPIGDEIDILSADASPETEPGAEPAVAIDALTDSDPEDDTHEDVDPNLAAAIALEESELTNLPGAGPGLVWLLNQNGINSMSDLAAADPTQLTADLHLVGQLLDVPSWISFARDYSANAHH